MNAQVGDALVEKLTEALADIAGGEPPTVYSPKEIGGQHRPDAILEVSLDGRPYRLVMDFKQSVFPRDAREALWRLRSSLSREGMADREAVPVLAAESISPGARDLLRRERVGYFDGDGNLFIAARGLYLRLDKPESRKQSRAVNNVFSGQRAQVLHAVWGRERDWFGVHEIAERAGVSPATASVTLAALERREWVEARGSGPSKERRLANPGALLDSWAAYQSSAKPKAVRHYYVRSAAYADLQRRLDDASERTGVRYELAGVSAGQVHAPYLSGVSQVACRATGGKPLQAMLEEVGARPVREGWNLGVQELRADDQLRFRQRIGDLWVADPLQAYLDLLQSGGRAKEMAQHLRAEKLGA